MGVEDPLLPAAAHLTGLYAGDVLRPAIEQAGGRLLTYRCTRVHYRPGRDLVAQFRTEIEWADGRRRRERIVAATTSAGAPAGSIAVTAETPEDDLIVGVWRWPFDPGLPALESVVGSAAAVLHDAGVDVGSDADVEVVTYRPIERAVLRVRAGARTWYLKAVRPTAAPMVVERHSALLAAGLPVPEVVAADPARGWMLVSELEGPTLRERIKTDAEIWIEPAELQSLIGRLREVTTLDTEAFRSRLVDGPHHASLLAAVLPDGKQRLARLTEHLGAAAARSRTRERGFVHGDLHEAQLVVSDGRITGLLDIDEAGFGDPVDDIAVPAAQLRHRALTAPNGARIERFVDDFLAECHADQHPDDVAAAMAAVLTGLATAPFRAQTEGWEHRVSAVLDLAERHIDPM